MTSPAQSSRRPFPHRNLLGISQLNQYEILDLLDRAVVDERPSTGRPGAPAAEVDRDARVQACVDETLRILRRERER